MANYYYMKQNGKTDNGVVELIVNTEADIASLPTNKWQPGSTVFVVNTSDVYMLNTDFVWKKI